MAILMPADSRLSEYQEDFYNHGIYNLHIDRLTGAIKGIITICPAVASIPEIRTAVDSSSLLKPAVATYSSSIAAVSSSTSVCPAVAATIKISHTNEVSV